MDALKKQLDRIQQQLAGLSASQKMLTASLAAIMVMTFLWWGRYAGTSEMEPVFNQSLTTEDIQRVKRVLTAENIPFQPQGDKLLVPTEKKDYAIAALAYAQVLPKDSSGSFEEMLGKMSPFAAPQQNDKMYNEMLQQRVAQIVSHMKGVAEANVLIDPTFVRGIDRTTEPSASVALRMSNGSSGDKKLAQAVAELVAGSNAHMRASRVKVLIDGKPFIIRDPDPTLPDGGELDEQLARNEAYFAEKVKEVLSGYSENVVAVVHAKIDLVKTKSIKTTYPKVTKAEKTSETDTTSTPGPTAPPVEPGTVPNASNSPLAIPASATATGSSAETDHSKSENEIRFDSTIEDLTKPSGEAKALSVAISLPRTVFVQELKGSDPSAKQPAGKDVEALFQSRKDDIVQAVMNAIGIEDTKQVSIVLGPDLPMMMATGSGLAASSSGGGGVTGSLTGHVKEIAVGVLALISLFMVMSMVKKSTPAPVVAAAVEVQEPVMLGGDLPIVGEVSEGGQTLDGMELDEDAIKAQQMVEQVSTMVKENPDGAANMVKRWLNRS